MRDADDCVLWRLWLGQHALPAVTASIELGIFRRLAHSTATTAEIANDLQLCTTALDATLHVLHSLKLVRLSRQAQTWSLTDTGSAYLVDSSPTFAGPYLCSSAVNAPAHDRLRHRLCTPSPAAGTTFSCWERGSFSGDLHRAEATVVHMHALHASNAIHAVHTLALVVNERCQTDRHGAPIHLLDAGGGSGVYAVCLAKAAPQLRCDVGELPEVVCAIHRHSYIPADVSHRVRAVELDLFAPAWPSKYDAVLLSSVMHDWSDAECASLLRHAFDALRPGGVILLHEVVLADADDGDEEKEQVAACLSLHMALYTRGGGQRTALRLHELLMQANFAQPMTLPTAGAFVVASAVKLPAADSAGLEAGAHRPTARADERVAVCIGTDCEDVGVRATPSSGCQALELDAGLEGDVADGSAIDVPMSTCSRTEQAGPRAKRPRI